MNISKIEPTLNPDLAAALDAAINNKTKPLGSLGRLEQLAKQIGLIQGTVHPRLDQPALLVLAGDHGVVAEYISAFPQSVTWQMVENFLANGAAINVFAAQHGFALQVVDTGVNHEFGARTGLINKKIASGTHNFALQAAMSPEQCAQAMRNGAELVAALAGNVVGFGEMGIGNTTAAAAIMHKLTGLVVAHCVGAGTGLDAAGIAHKQQVIELAVARHPASLPLEVLHHFGGFEIATMVGAILEAAHLRKVILIDGFICTSALLVAASLTPDVLDYCIFSHCSDEHGHRAMLDYLQADPVLQLGLRLGEGTGCALVYPLLQSAILFLDQMATFEAAQVSGKSNVQG